MESPSSAAHASAAEDDDYDEDDEEDDAETLWAAGKGPKPKSPEPTPPPSVPAAAPPPRAPSPVPPRPAGVENVHQILRFSTVFFQEKTKHPYLHKEEKLLALEQRRNHVSVPASSCLHPAAAPPVLHHMHLLLDPTQTV